MKGNSKGGQHIGGIRKFGAIGGASVGLDPDLDEVAALFEDGGLLHANSMGLRSGASEEGDASRSRLKRKIGRDLSEQIQGSKGTYQVGTSGAGLGGLIADDNTGGTTIASSASRQHAMMLLQQQQQARWRATGIRGFEEDDDEEEQ